MTKDEIFEWITFVFLTIIAGLAVTMFMSVRENSRKIDNIERQGQLNYEATKTVIDTLDNYGFKIINN